MTETSERAVTRQLEDQRYAAIVRGDYDDPAMAVAPISDAHYRSEQANGACAAVAWGVSSR